MWMLTMYYGMRDHCGRGTVGWRWLDVRTLAKSLCGWQRASVHRVVYCTARVDPSDNQSAYADQDVYLKALRAHGSIDVLELGRYVAWAKVAPLANKTRSGGVQVITPSGTESWSSDPHPCHHGKRRGSFAPGYGAGALAIVISNDSDLALPLEIARTLVPVGTVNPGTKPLAGALRGLPNDGAGRHWWGKLSARQYYNNQMPNPVGRWSKPIDW